MSSMKGFRPFPLPILYWFLTIQKKKKKKAFWHSKLELTVDLVKIAKNESIWKLLPLNQNAVYLANWRSSERNERDFTEYSCQS